MLVWWAVNLKTFQFQLSLANEDLCFWMVDLSTWGNMSTLFTAIWLKLYLPVCNNAVVKRESPYSALRCSAYTKFMTGSCIHHPDVTEWNAYIFSAERGLKPKLVNFSRGCQVNKMIGGFQSHLSSSDGYTQEWNKIILLLTFSRSVFGRNCIWKSKWSVYKLYVLSPGNLAYRINIGNK